MQDRATDATARRLVVTDDAESVAALRAAIDAAAARYGLSTESAFALKLAATEAVANALRHADDRRAEVSLAPAEDAVEVEVVSRGAFQLHHGLDPERGRGLPLIVACADEAAFARENGGTRVRIRKRAA